MRDINYMIDEHQHRLAVWAACRAASVRSKGCGLKVEKGVLILDSVGFTKGFTVKDLPKVADFDATHKQWRKKVIEQGKEKKTRCNFTHGSAAKLINCYFKVRFVCGGYSKHPRVKCIHPPIDSLLLKSLFKKAKKIDSDLALVWARKTWTKLSSIEYEQIIEGIRCELGKREPLWKIEVHWKPEGESVS